MNSKRPVRKAARSNSVHGFSGIAEGGAAPLSLPLLLSLCHCGACCPAVQHCPVENGCTAIWIGWCHLIGEVKRASAKDVVARQNPSDYSPRLSGGMPPILVPERGAAWLAHQSGGLGVVGSNPAAPTMNANPVMAKRLVPGAGCFASVPVAPAAATTHFVLAPPCTGKLA